MRAALRADLQAGTYGMSTELEYGPGIYSQPEEALALAREVGAAGGVVMSHMRSENDDQIDQSIDELAARGAYARVHISHLKVVFGTGAERGRQLLAVIDGKRRAGVDLTADVYPYNAGYTGIATARRCREKKRGETQQCSIISRPGRAASVSSTR